MTTVLHVSQATGDGLDRFLTDVLSDQARRGWRVGLACPEHEPLVALCARLGVEHHPWIARREPSLSVLREMRALRRVITRVAPDVVHLHSSKAGLAGRLVVRRRRPTIFTPHAWSFLHEGAITRRLALAWERRAARWTTVALCVSEGERERGVGAGVRTEYRVVPNAVDLEAFRPVSQDQRRELRERLGLDAGPVALCVGRLAPQKGQDVLLDAWPSIAAAVEGATLVLLGDGPQRAALEQRYVPGVRFVGRRDDVRDWFAASDVVVQPSRWEGLSYVTLEAMASGRSIVVTDVDGMRDALGDPPTGGAIVPAEDPEALAEELILRLGDPQRAEREGALARSRAERFDHRVWGDAISAVTVEAMEMA